MRFFKKGSSVAEHVTLKFEETNQVLTVTHQDGEPHDYKLTDCFIEQIGRYHFIYIPHGYFQIESDLIPWIKNVKGRKVQKNKPQKKNSTIFILGYFLIFLFIITAFFNEHILYNYLPDRTEQYLYDRVVFFLQFDESKLYKTEQIERIEKIFKDYDPDLKDVSIYIYPETEVNAVTLPNKKVFIYEGLIHQCESYAELIGIVAHEMGHVKHKHIIKNSVKAILLDAFSYFLTGLDIGIGLYMLSYSRENEREADTYAAQFLKNKQYSFSGIIDFFKRNNKKMNFSFFNTHPKSKDRVVFFKDMDATH